MLVLVAGTGEVGRQMIGQGWHIPLQAKQSLMARAARTRRSVLVNDVHSDPTWLPHPLLPDTQAELALPLLIGDQLLGVLDLQSNEVNHFSPDDVHVQSTLAAQIAVALRMLNSTKSWSNEPSKPRWLTGLRANF